jgi:hypothetical protein
MSIRMGENVTVPTVILSWTWKPHFVMHASPVLTRNIRLASSDSEIHAFFRVVSLRRNLNFIPRKFGILDFGIRI